MIPGRKSAAGNLAARKTERKTANENAEMSLKSYDIRI
jgi:hypothetical protein